MRAKKQTERRPDFLKIEAAFPAHLTRSHRKVDRQLSRNQIETTQAEREPSHAGKDSKEEQRKTGSMQGRKTLDECKSSVRMEKLRGQ